MKDIEDIEDIRLFVDDFYAKVRHDDLIGPVFLEVISDWEPHLKKMYAFWNAVLFGVAGFKGNPFARHAPLDIRQDHFERWLTLFAETIDSYFEGPVAEDAKKRAEIMAEMFLARLGQLAGNADKVVM
ncbi:MAG: group III truncated hemoglobin [Bacteroidetes bacterium]|nr:group III truncated hemoglobin [Bacteroidota bacterium]